MYSGPSQETPETPSAGMYSQAATPSLGGGFDFSNLSSGGQTNLQVGQNSINSVDPNQTGMYQAYKSAEAQKYGDLTGLMGTGLQTEAQKSVANTNIQPAMTKLNLQQNEYFPFLKELLLKNGLGGGSSGVSSLISSVTNAANPSYEQAAINAADAAAARAAAESQQNQYGQLAGVAGSPFRSALAAASNAGAMAAGEEAKRKIRDDYAQRRVGNLASAVSAQSSSMNPLYSLFGSMLS